jgi:transposase
MPAMEITQGHPKDGEVKDFLKRDLDMETCSDDRYSIFETEINYGGIDQKWVVIDSREMHASKAKTFDKKIDKEFTETKKSLKKLGRLIFACEADARKAAERWLSENPPLILQNLKEYSETVLNQLGKPTARPTLKWIFQKFNINEAIFEFKGAIQREVINLNHAHPSKRSP